MGLHKSKKKIDAILLAPTPTNVNEVEAFTGLVNYYSRFVANLASSLFPINQLLRKDIPFMWSKASEESFRAVKKEIASEKILTHFDFKLLVLVDTDASSHGLCCVLSHLLSNGEKANFYSAQGLFRRLNKITVK